MANITDGITLAELKEKLPKLSSDERKELCEDIFNGFCMTCFDKMRDNHCYCCAEE